MKTMARVLIVAATCSPVASAEVIGDGAIIARYAIAPAAPTDTTPLQARIDLPGCIPVEPVLRIFKVSASEIRLGFEVLDYCDASLVPRTQTYPLGVLPAGEYAVTYLRCFGNVLPGQEPCTKAGAERITVSTSHAGRPRNVPALSPRAFATSVILVFLIAAWRLRRR